MHWDGVLGNEWDMPDTISTYRQVRLIINPTSSMEGRTYWSLHAVAVLKGVPHTRVLGSGYVFDLGSRPSEQAIWAMIRALADSQVSPQ